MSRDGRESFAVEPPDALGQATAMGGEGVDPCRGLVARLPGAQRRDDALRRGMALGRADQPVSFQTDAPPSTEPATAEPQATIASTSRSLPRRCEVSVTEPKASSDTLAVTRVCRAGAAW